MKLHNQIEAYNYVKSLYDRFTAEGKLEAANFLEYYLSGADAANTGERADDMIWALKEFVKKFRSLLTPEDIKNLQEAREGYARSNRVVGIGDIE